jgi:hypothetical protein
MPVSIQVPVTVTSVDDHQSVLAPSSRTTTVSGSDQDAEIRD